MAQLSQLGQVDPARDAGCGAARVEVEAQREGMQRLWRLTHDTDEVLTIVPEPRLDIGFIQRARPTQLRGLRRGVQMHTLYHRDIVSHAPSLMYINDLVTAGAKARSSARLPTWMAIIGRRVVVTPADPARPNGDVLFIFGSGHLRTALWLFGIAWHASIPLLADGGQPFLTPMERGVLTSLANGLKDERGARELGISPRTYRRCVTDLCTRLGASSRFQAGVRAAENGLMNWTR